MKNIRDFEEYQIEKLTKEAIEYAKIFNAYMDDKANEREMLLAGSKVSESLLFYLGVRFEKDNVDDEYSLSHFVFDGRK